MLQALKNDKYYFLNDRLSCTCVYVNKESINELKYSLNQNHYVQQYSNRSSYRPGVYLHFVQPAGDHPCRTFIKPYQPSR